MDRRSWIIAAMGALIFVLGVALAFMIGRASSTAGHEPPINAASNQIDAQPERVASPASEEVQQPANPPAARAQLRDPTTGPAFVEDFEGTRLTFVPIAREPHRRLIEYRVPTIDRASDSSCTEPYSATERVTRIQYAWDFVIERFWTWNEREGQQEYNVDEAGALPNAFHGSLHDLVRDNVSLRITKQRCGQGQVAGLVAIRA